MTDDLLSLGERALRGDWPQVRLHDPVVLEGSDRATVVRVAVTDGPAATVVVKAHHHADSQVREPAALLALRGLPGAAQLLGVSTDPAGVVLADLGSGGSVADVLLGADPQAARSAVLAWAAALGGLHRVPTERFEQALGESARRLGVDPPPVDGMPAALARSADQLAPLLLELGLPTDALEELRLLDGLLAGPRGLTPSDACPDNNLLTAEGLVLLDFEGAQVRHLAWDAAYLTVPWPSCWCSWRMPDDVCRDGLATWKGALSDPYVDSDAFDADLRLATVGWALVSMAWFLEQALADDPPEVSTPSRRAMIGHRLTQAVGLADPRVPGLTALAAGLLERTGWGSERVALAPAFTGRRAP